MIIEPDRICRLSECRKNSCSSQILYLKWHNKEVRLKAIMLNPWNNDHFLLSEQKRNKTAIHSVPKTQQVYGNPYTSSKKHDPQFIFDSVHTDLQVPSLAPVIKAVPKRYSLFFVYGGQGKSAVGISHKVRVSVDSVCGGLWLFSIQIWSARK